mmetsp:Transcript_31087/g.33965  ORF Transcript_31087/g.33965 Transcript_31087/m.33965 type:complete len:83 (+) Transcript_31087:2674-2922(+)
MGRGQGERQRFAPAELSAEENGQLSQQKVRFGKRGAHEGAQEVARLQPPPPSHLTPPHREAETVPEEEASDLLQALALAAAT